MEKLYLGILGPRKHLKCPGSWGREVNWMPQACGLCHARSTSRPLDASSSDLHGSETEARTRPAWQQQWLLSRNKTVDL